MKDFSRYRPQPQGAYPRGRLRRNRLTSWSRRLVAETRLAADDQALFGYPPVIPNRQWRQTNASRYIRMFQSRRSLLIWKLYGQRMDGWSNADHPTESIPGDPATLPPGASPNEADLDFSGAQMPPPPATPLSEDDKLLFVRWIDLGAPIDLDSSGYGWLLDDLRPALTVSTPRPGHNSIAIDDLRFAYADANSGIDPGTLSVRASFVVNGRPADSELVDLVTPLGADRYRITLATPLAELPDGWLRVSVADAQGNITRVDQSFSVGSQSQSLFSDGFE